MPKKYYEILGVAETASEAEIRTAYRQLSLKYHPDKVATSGLTVKQATEKMQEINEACEVLMNPEKRVHYDRRGDNENDDTNDTSSSTDGLFDLKNFKELVIYLMTCHIGQNGISDEELKKSGFDFYNEDIRDKKSHREVADYIWLYRNWAESQGYRYLVVKNNVLDLEVQLLVPLSWLRWAREVKWGLLLTPLLLLGWLGISIHRRKKANRELRQLGASGDNDKIYFTREEKKQLWYYHQDWFLINLLGYFFFVPLSALIGIILLVFIGKWLGLINQVAAFIAGAWAFFFLALPLMAVILLGIIIRHLVRWLRFRKEYKELDKVLAKVGERGAKTWQQHTILQH